MFITFRLKENVICALEQSLHKVEATMENKETDVVRRDNLWGRGLIIQKDPVNQSW